MVAFCMAQRCVLLMGRSTKPARRLDRIQERRRGPAVGWIQARYCPSRYKPVLTNMRITPDTSAAAATAAASPATTQ
jgi:hypothetical protein